jgi:hypothetical protein
MAKEECVACGDSFNQGAGEAIRLRCRHLHCLDCLKRNAQSSLTNKPFAPAKCCSRVIDLDALVAAGSFTPEETKQYESKVEELTTPESKLYCYACNAFIPKSNYSKVWVATCEACKVNTCRRCGHKSHRPGCKPENLVANKSQSDAVLSLASSKKWKKCPNCTQLIEKAAGCNFMM